MTELAPAGIIAAVDDAVPGSCGKVCINSEAKIVDVESGKELGPNERGELLIRGPQVSERRGMKLIRKTNWSLRCVTFKGHERIPEKPEGDERHDP